MHSATTNYQFQDFSLLLLRLVVVSIFLYHGVPKAIDWPWSTQTFIGFGLPGFLGIITGMVEVVASVFILLRFCHRWSNLVLLFIISGAIAIVQIPRSLSAATVSAGLERDLLILVGILILAAFDSGTIGAAQRTQ